MRITSYNVQALQAELSEHVSKVKVMLLHVLVVEEASNACYYTWTIFYYSRLIKHDFMQDRMVFKLQMDRPRYFAKTNTAHEKIQAPVNNKCSWFSCWQTLCYVDGSMPQFRTAAGTLISHRQVELVFS